MTGDRPFNIDTSILNPKPQQVEEQTLFIDYLKKAFPLDQNLYGRKYGPITLKSQLSELENKRIKHSENSHYLCK